MTDQTPVVYTSPDGQTDMPVVSPADAINLEHRGWTRKDGGAPASTSPQPAADSSGTPKARRRQAAEE